ncbi:hypothetical protein LXL04_000360 [Taraxacum kok-saghyz]
MAGDSQKLVAKKNWQETNSYFSGLIALKKKSKRNPIGPTGGDRPDCLQFHALPAATPITRMSISPEPNRTGPNRGWNRTRINAKWRTDTEPSVLNRCRCPGSGAGAGALAHFCAGVGVGSGSAKFPIIHNRYRPESLFPVPVPVPVPSVPPIRYDYWPFEVLLIEESRSFENSYIPENPRTPKPLTFSKNRLRGAKNRSNISPVAKIFFRKNDFFFSKNFAYVQTFFFCICAQSLYNIYLKRFVKKI